MEEWRGRWVRPASPGCQRVEATTSQANYVDDFHPIGMQSDCQCARLSHRNVSIYNSSSYSLSTSMNPSEI